MTTFTSAAIGSTGQNLDGLSVSTSAGPDLFLEAVSIGDPQDGGALAPVSSTFGLTVNIASTVVASTQIVSSIPFYVAQSSAPWSVNVSTAIPGTTSVNVVSSVAHALVGTSQISGIISSQIISSIPFFVAQSSAPWSFVETVSTAGGPNVTTISLKANLNTTVIKAAAGNMYGIFGSNVGSSNVFVRMYNFTTAALTIASTAVPMIVFGMPISSSPVAMFDLGVTFSSGITILTQQQPYTASASVSPTASTATITIMFQ